MIRTVRDENARALRMHAERADVAVNVFSPTLLPALANDPKLTVVTRPGANLTYIVVRADRPPLDDARLRGAISGAIDRKTIAETLLAGRAQPATTLFPEGHWAHASLPLHAFDPVFARAAVRNLLPEGQMRLKLSLLTSTDRLRGSIARTIAQELRDVGIDLEVVPLELGTLLARLSAGDFELATLQLPELAEPNTLRTFLHSTSIPPAGSNRGRVRDPVLDTLLDDGDRQADELMRKDTYALVERRVRERLPIIPLWHEDQVAVVGARARGFMPSAEGRWLGLAALP